MPNDRWESVAPSSHVRTTYLPEKGRGVALGSFCDANEHLQAAESQKPAEAHRIGGSVKSDPGMRSSVESNLKQPVYLARHVALG